MADFRYQLISDLILVDVTLFGIKRSHNASFIFDTGSSGIIIDHTIAFDLGYSAREGIGLSTVSSAIGREKGYRLKIDALESLGQRLTSVEVRCHDLKNQGVEGLLGMAFLKHFDWCVYPGKQVVSLKKQERSIPSHPNF